jgi:uncharacterized protein YqjF (DUF2071 family)
MLSKEFLSGEWRKLIMINYVINPDILMKFIPRGTRIDLWNNNCYVSLVGFMFKNTRLKGIPIPFHLNFEEVNLRFYVQYPENSIQDYKRGVVFIKELVPKPALTFVANTIFKEHYETCEMNHEWLNCDDKQFVKYAWNINRWNSISVEARNELTEIRVGSEEEFITEHYWGYTLIDNETTSEYEVKHPKWKINEVLDYTINVDFESTYGQEFRFLNNERPTSVFLAEGSEISVYPSKKMKFQ